MLARWMLRSEDEIAATFSKLEEPWTRNGGRERSEMRSVLLLKMSLKIVADSRSSDWESFFDVVEMLARISCSV